MPSTEELTKKLKENMVRCVEILSLTFLQKRKESEPSKTNAVDFILPKQKKKKSGDVE